MGRESGFIEKSFRFVREIMGYITGYRNKAESLARELRESDGTISEQKLKITGLETRLSGNKRRLEAWEGELERARKITSEIAVEKIGYQRQTIELEKTHQEVKALKQKQKRQKAQISRRTLMDQLESYRMCPPHGVMLYLDRRGVIRYQSDEAWKLLENDFIGQHISKLIFGNEDEIKKTAEHFNFPGEGYLYIQKTPKTKMPAHIHVSPQTFPYGFDENPEDVRYATVVKIRKSRYHAIFNKLRLGSGIEFYQDSLRKDVEASAQEQKEKGRLGIMMQENY